LGIYHILLVDHIWTTKFTSLTCNLPKWLNPKDLDQISIVNCKIKDGCWKISFNVQKGTSKEEGVKDGKENKSNNLELKVAKEGDDPISNSTYAYNEVWEHY